MEKLIIGVALICIGIKSSLININMSKKISFPSLFVFFVIIISLTFAPAVLAAETATAGITPSNPLYFFDTLAEKISLAFAFNPATKVTKAMGYAAEKFAELAIMMQKNNERGQARANQRYQEMVKTVTNKLAEAMEKDSEFKNMFIPKMMVVINGYNNVIRAQDPEKTKELGKIAKEENDLFIKTYEAPQKSFLSLNLSLEARKEKLCEAAFSRPITDDITKVFDMLCGQEFVGILAADKQKQDTVYKAMFDAANRNDISDTTKALVQQIALIDLPVSQAGSSAAAAVKAAPECKNANSRQIACNFTCASNNCPANQDAEAKRKGCLKPIYYSLNGNASFKEAAEQEAQSHINEECGLRGEGQKQCQVSNCDTVVLLFPDGRERTVKSCCCSCTNEDFDNKSRRVFDPWGWEGKSLIDRLLSPAEIKDDPSTPLVSDQRAPSFIVSQNSCVGFKDIPWYGEGTIIPNKIALSSDNEETFVDNLQSAFQEARRNCPGGWV
jgi:hypothetical protein